MGLSKDSPFVEMEPYLKANVELSRSLFTRFLKDSKGKRFIFISSLYALDDSVKATSYAKSKAIVERELLNPVTLEFKLFDLHLSVLPKARGFLGPLQQLAMKGIGIRFPRVFK